jgi:serine-protein kinase ATM
MATLNLHDVCNKLTSSQVRPRLSALNDLERFLISDDAISRLNDEKTYSGLLQSLIQNFSIEFTAFRKSNSTQATTLLRLSVECFKASVEKIRLIITRAIVKMLLTHIVGSLPDPGQSGYRETAPSFFATLKLITSHPPHVEQVRKDMWEKLVQLCTTHIDVVYWYNLSSTGDQPATADDEGIKSFSAPQTLPMRKEIVDMMFSLQSLILFPGAPFYGEEENLLSFLLNFLASYDTPSDARMSAIIALNRILEHICVNQTDLATRASTMVLDLVSKVWASRMPGFKQRLLISLSFIYPHLHFPAISHGLSIITRTRIETLLSKLQDDMRYHENKLGLQPDDIILSTLPQSFLHWQYRPFQCFIGPYFSLNPHSASAEFPWLSLQLQSCFIRLLDLVPSDARPVSPAVGEDHQTKRRRLTPNPNFQKLLDEIVPSKIQQSGSPVSLLRLTFYLNSFHPLIDCVDLVEVLSRLKNIVDESPADIVGWALVCILTIVGRTEGLRSTIVSSDQWTRIWVASLKQAALSSTCRPACSVMEAIIRKDILDVRSLIPHLSGIIEYVEQRGPGSFADNSCDFWDSLVHKLEDAGVPIERWRNHALTRWTRFRWDVRGIGDTVSRNKRSSMLVFSTLRFLSSAKWSSACRVDFNYIQSLPQSVIGESLKSIFSNMPLINFLFDSRVNGGIHPSQPDRSAVGLEKIDLLDNVRNIIEDKCRDVCMEIEQRLVSNDTQGSAIPVEDLSWMTTFSIICMLLLRKQTL